MIILATIFRVIDGLPLSASTDIVQKTEIKECQKYVKLVSKKLYQLADKCTLELQKYRIHLLSCGDISFLVLVEESYSTLLAFSFLNDVQKEFLAQYNRDVVASIKRPYSFIEFDLFLQKTKQRYNSPRNLSTKLNLATLSEELKLRPAYLIREEDLYLGIHSSYFNEHGQTHQAAKAEYRPPVVPSVQLIALSWLGWMSVGLNVFCAALNLLRSAAILSRGHFEVDDQEGGLNHCGVMFLLAAVFVLYQMYLTLYAIRHRVAHAVTALVSLVCFHLAVAHLRNWVQVAFHLAACCLATVVIVTRTTQGKLPGYNV